MFIVNTSTTTKRFTDLETAVSYIQSLGKRYRKPYTVYDTVSKAVTHYCFGARFYQLVEGELVELRPAERSAL